MERTRTLRLLAQRIALSACAACDAEPANVLTGPEGDAGACQEGAACDASMNISPDDCPCVPGVRVGCLETLDTGDAGCATIFGTKRCEPDGTWTTCMGPVTTGTLQGISCTLVNAGCGPLGVFSSTSGDCTKALLCAPKQTPP